MTRSTHLLGLNYLVTNEIKMGTFEVQETRIAKAILRNVEVFVNVEANIGFYSCLALHNKVYPVIFESMQSNLSILCRNIFANGFSNGSFEIYPLALSDRSGLMEMFGSGTGASLIKGWDNVPGNNVLFVEKGKKDVYLPGT